MPQRFGNLMRTYWPRFDLSEFENSVPAIEYLDWYIPRLIQERKHNLSFSGMQYDWDIPELLQDGIYDIGKKHMGKIEDPRIIIANREGVNVENVLICHGATQGINLSLLAMITKLRSLKQNIVVAVESPTYAPLPQSALILANEVIKIKRNPPSSGIGNWKINKQEWADAMIKSDILMLTPVSNPSGWNLDPDDRNWIADFAEKHNVGIIADEVYIDAYRSKTNFHPMHKYGNGNISINSLTKIYSLGQIRFGWIISDKDTIEVARRVFMTFSGVMGSPTMRIASAALRRLSEVDAAIEHYRSQNLPKLRAVLQRFSIKWNEPEAGIFGCFELPNNILGEDFADGPCKDNDLLVIPGSMFCDSLKNWVRVAWSIEPKSFGLAISALENSLNSAIN